MTMDDILLEIARRFPLERPLLVQHGQTKKRHEYPCGHGETVYLRGVRPNEVYLENDTATYEEQRAAVLAIQRYLGPEHCLVAWSGHKSFHISFFFDPGTLPSLDGIDTDLVDVLKVVRLFLFRKIPEVAGVGIGYDPSNVNWHMAKTGHMVRWVGSIKPDAKPGTTPFTFINGPIPESRPTASRAAEEPARVPGLWCIPQVLWGPIREEWEKEQARCADSNRWIDALYASLPDTEAVTA